MDAYTLNVQGKMNPFTGRQWVLCTKQRPVVFIPFHIYIYKNFMGLQYGEKKTLPTETDMFFEHVRWNQSAEARKQHFSSVFFFRHYACIKC